MKRLIAIMLLCLPTCVSAESQTVYLQVDWQLPITNPEWQPWMEGKTVLLKTSVATENGQYDYNSYVTLGAKTAHVSMVMDTTGLPEGYTWIVAARIPGQYIHNNYQDFTHISTDTKFRVCYGEEYPFSQYLQLWQIKLFNE